MIYRIPLTRIKPNRFQPSGRLEDADIASLVEEIRPYLESHPETNGLLQLPAGRLVDNAGRVRTPPKNSDGIDVLLDAENEYCELIYGHRRWKALEALGLDWMPVELSMATDEEAATMAWTENEARKDLTPIQRAEMIKSMIDGNGWTQEQAAKKLGLSRPTITNILKLLSAGEEIRAPLAEGKISERQAQALLALQELPKPLLEAAEKSFYGPSPSDIIKSALAGASSDQLRQKIANIVDHVAAELTEDNINFPLDHVFAGDEFVSPTCTACPDRIKRDQKTYCPSRPCLNLKYAAWVRWHLEGVSKLTGIQIQEKDDYSGERFYGASKEHIQAIKAGECEHRRLYYDPYVREESHHNFHAEGFPKVALKCTRRGGCTCLKALKAGEEVIDKEAAKRAEAAEKAAKKAIKDARGQAVDAILKALQENKREVWLEVLVKIDHSTGRAAAEWDLDRIKRKISERLISDPYTYGDKKFDLAYHVKHWNDQLNAMGLPPLALAPSSPGEIPGFADLARRFDRISRWVDNLLYLTEPPALEAVSGNIVNLTNLKIEYTALLEKLSDAERQVLGESLSPLVTDENAVDDLCDRLTELEKVLVGDDWPPADFDHFPGLVATAAGDPNFTALAQRASSPVLRYAIALISGRDGHGVRAGALRKELNGRLTEVFARKPSEV